MRASEFSRFHLDINGETKGPLTLNQVRSMWGRAEITGDTIFCVEGMSDWEPLAAVINLIEPPPTPPIQPVMTPEAATYLGIKQAIHEEHLRHARTKTTYQLLALFFGSLGVHNFYAALWWQGIAQLLISCTMFGLMITIPWALVEAFAVDRDGNGVLFKK